ncbi:MAG TPA: glycosyltransferase, partial [Rhizomicrobium sp.]|nr:glycosyltransferase [Rhizomicrobium sp.]
VYHGLPEKQFHEGGGGGGYLAFLGRICPEKGPEQAIAIAGKAGMRLKMAAKVDPVDRAYFEDVVRPLLTANPHVEFIGEINDSRKQDFLGNARALLFPIAWPEPFGLVMIEAMACGTPVIAYRCGSVPEVLEDGLTGFVVDNEEDAVKAVLRLDRLFRPTIRSRFEERFSARAMATEYCGIYRRLIGLQGLGGRTVEAA